MPPQIPAADTSVSAGRPEPAGNSRGFAEYPARLVHATNAHFAFDSGKVPGTTVPPSQRVRRNGIARGGEMVS
jgi:hypothetical protein